MSDEVIKVIDEQIEKLEYELTKLRNLKRIAKGSPVTERITSDVVVDYLSKHPDVTVNQVSTGLGVSYNQAADVVHVAEREKKIERSSPKRKRFIRYRVAPPKTGTPKAEVVATAKAHIKPKRKGKRATRKQIETRNQMIMDYLNTHPGFHPISEIEDATQITSPTYVRNFLEKHPELVVKQQGTSYKNGKVNPAMTYAAKRETKVIPGDSVEPGRLRQESVTRDWKAPLDM